MSDRISPDIAAKAKQANAANIIKKLQAGKTISKHEQGALEEITERPKTAIDLPIFDSIASCASVCGIPLRTLKQAKRNGCPAFKNTRVYLRDFLVWAFTQEEVEDGVDWSQALQKVKTERERIKLAVDNDSVLDLTNACAITSRAVSVLVSALDRVFLSELPPRIKGLSEMEIRAKNEEAVDAIKKELLQNLEELTKKFSGTEVH